MVTGSCERYLSQAAQARESGVHHEGAVVQHSFRSLCFMSGAVER